jgi:hypothetical protein
MNRKNALEDIERALSDLKDFQQSTADCVFQQLYGNGTKAMLVADEVGLGKTIVAKGVIAQAIKERIAEDKRKPFKVTYICSNQAIAHENITKLNLFPGKQALREAINRIAFLAVEPEETEQQGANRFLQINFLTPATSFTIKSSTGTKRERAIIYSLLYQDPEIGRYPTGLACLLKGMVRQEISQYRSWLQQERKGNPLREGLQEKFIMQLKKESVSRQDYFDYEPGRERISLYDAVYGYASTLRANNEKDFRSKCNELTKRMRRILINECLSYVEADLYILDEFQRFRGLIDVNSEEEQAIIARKVFASPKSKILLLSATPFKAYTSYDEVDRGEDHYRDFRLVLEFLLQKDEKTLAKYDEHRQGLYRQLLALRKGDFDLSSQHRNALQEILRSVMCRTERVSVSEEAETMIEDISKDQLLKMTQGDIENFVATDEIVLKLNEVLEKRHQRHPKPIEFCKSAPFPFSYLDRYLLKERIKREKRDRDFKNKLKAVPQAWLDLKTIDKYSFVVGEPGVGKSGGVNNARVAQLVNLAIGNQGHELLWVPPSLPYYALRRSFAGQEGFSKTLVFSSWVMVPRMIGTLLSYEVERRTIGNSKTADKQEQGKRTYFPKKGKENYRRRPAPILTYSRTRIDGRSRLSNMSNFSLIYPCLSLIKAYDPIDCFRRGLSLKEIRAEIAGKIRKMIKEAGLAEFERETGESEKWYWAAPLLLDRHYDQEDFDVDWLDDRDFRRESTFFKSRNREESAKANHFDELRRCFQDPEIAGLGRLPGDIVDILVDITLGAPAILIYRSLKNLYPNSPEWYLLINAFEMGDEFLDLFNKPESIAALRLKTPGKTYWRRVLNYCIDGCLQAVLDEYLHILKDQNLAQHEVEAQLRDSININISSINVDGLNTFIAGRSQKMRCHYAVDFGNQKFETKEGQNRVINLRKMFNSPFRPFVLATTSIGQEGLDFHTYCRRVVHWNLPSNPIDLEQREGRINRYKGLVIRQQIAARYGDQLKTYRDGDTNSPWEQLFEIADDQERRKKDKCELVPYWHVESGEYKIERVVPIYPFSRDKIKLERILQTLSIYRLAFGQPRQAELVEHLLQYEFSEEEVQLIRENLMIDLCPFNY